MAIGNGFAQTCWRGVRVVHPADWEPARLSGLGEPGQCVFVDRTYQRLEVHWRPLPRPPDLKEMYKRLARSFKDQHNAPLAGVAGWEGLVRTERSGQVVHAGRYFPDRHWLVEAVITWPGGRDPLVERTVLAATGPLPEGPITRWQALGLDAIVATDMALVEASSRVGTVAWKFARPKRKGEGLTLERLAMPEVWLKKPLEEWLAEQLPKGLRRLGPVRTGGGDHRPVEIDSRPANPLARLVGLATARVDRAWICPGDGRLYHAASWRRGSRPTTWPEWLEVNCCRTVRPGAGW